MKTRHSMHISVTIHSFGDHFYAEVLHPALDGHGDNLHTGPICPSPNEAYVRGVADAMGHRLFEVLTAAFE